MERMSQLYVGWLQKQSQAGEDEDHMIWSVLVLGRKRSDWGKKRTWISEQVDYRGLI